MIEDLIKQHAGEITDLLHNKFALNKTEATSASEAVSEAIGNFLSNQITSGKADIHNLVDLFNTNTANKSNALFSGLSNSVMSALTKAGLSKDVVSKISTDGLDDIIAMLSRGKMGNMNLGTLTQLLGALGGKNEGLGGMLGNLGNLLGKKNK